ncbi:hypothetical protein [Amnimonas aquatica]|uniref:Uncharacterized protein n=1 Tax=Amnimonas aquatica TaxID=2094561 RepID=A0A2P6ARP7_9GAMM|nr:hypothetical protein [Amnimonas aquatica]PQA38553.1 hypothetical protein C5O18_07070 [Amnimonas aquatica]
MKLSYLMPVLMAGLLALPVAASATGLHEFTGTGEWAASRGEACDIAVGNAQKRIGNDYEVVSSSCLCDKDGSRFNCLAGVKVRPLAPEQLASAASPAQPAGIR